MLPQVQAYSIHYFKTLFCKTLQIRYYYQIQKKNLPNFKNNYSCLFSPFNKTHHESPLIFLNVKTKAESVKPLSAATEVKISPLCSYREWGYSLVPALDVRDGLSEYESLHLCPWHCLAISASVLLRIKCQ